MSHELKQQTTIALFATKTEYMAITEAEKKAL